MGDPNSYLLFLVLTFSSDIRKAVAARARKQGDHPFAIQSNCLERSAMG
jgi:hypothetical protein